MNILEDILNDLLQTRLGNEVKKNTIYKTSLTNVLNTEEKYYSLNLTEYQRKVIDTYIDSINENGAIYGECAYKTGFKDCTILLKELGILK